MRPGLRELRDRRAAAEARPHRGPRRAGLAQPPRRRGRDAPTRSPRAPGPPRRRRARDRDRGPGRVLLRRAGQGVGRRPGRRAVGDLHRARRRRDGAGRAADASSPASDAMCCADGARVGRPLLLNPRAWIRDLVRRRDAPRRSAPRFLVAIVVGSGICRATAVARNVGLAAARELDRDRCRARRADPRARSGLRRALQPGRHAGGPRSSAGPRPRRAASTSSSQVVGACVGAMVANLMFDLPAVDALDARRARAAASGSARSSPTFGLLLVILGVVRARSRVGSRAFAVGGYIAAAYWFTSSTSFANPAVTIGRIAHATPSPASRRAASRCSS